MNEQFIEGFVKKAVALGYDDDTIIGLFKSAMGQPDPQDGPSQMFNTLPQMQTGGAPQQGVPPEHMQMALQQMMTNPQQAGQLKQLLGIA